MLKLQSVGKKLHSPGGMSLLEILVAVAFLGIALTALIGLGSVGLKNSGTSRNTVLADQYAREGVEMLRSYRDNKGWEAFRRVDGRASDIPIWGQSTPECGGVSQRYYRTYALPASGVPPMNPNGYSCGTHANFTNPADPKYQWLQDWCATTPWATAPAGSPHMLTGQVVKNFYRFIIIGFETTDKAFIRSVVCYYEGPNIRSVQVDSYLTDWQ